MLGELINTNKSVIPAKAGIQLRADARDKRQASPHVPQFQISVHHFRLMFLLQHRHFSFAAAHSWIPAFAGMTLWGGVINLRRGEILKTILLLLVFSFLVALPLAAKTTDELQQVEQELAAQKDQAATLAEQEKMTAGDLASLQQRLIAATATLQEKQAEQERLETRLSELEDETTARSAELGTAHARLTTLTESLLRLSREPPATFLLHGELTDEALHRAILLRALLPHLQTEADKLVHELQDLETLRQTAAEQKHLVAAAQNNLERQQADLDSMIKTRQGKLQKTAAQKEAITEQLAALAAEAQDLRQLLAKVSPARSFRHESSALRAGLKMPVAGRITRHFGEKDSYGVASEGLTLAGRPNSPVVAPQDGRVAFIGPFRGYGQIVILQHADDHHSFLAGFSRIDAELGQNVAAGEPLGVLPASSGHPELYFEWRHHGEPTDPLMSSH